MRVGAGALHRRKKSVIVCKGLMACAMIKKGVNEYAGNYIALWKYVVPGHGFIGWSKKRICVCSVIVSHSLARTDFVVAVMKRVRE